MKEKIPRSFERKVSLTNIGITAGFIAIALIFSDTVIRIPNKLLYSRARVIKRNGGISKKGPNVSHDTEATSIHIKTGSTAIMTINGESYNFYDYSGRKVKNGNFRPPHTIVSLENRDKVRVSENTYTTLENGVEVIHFTG
ncbi:MAG: hypothetical protein Q8P65_00575 [bacterium]|nr:hypothetical protein [bacterium]